MEENFRLTEKWRIKKLEVETFPPNFYLTDMIGFQVRPLYKDQSFLQKKYSEEGLSVTQIAAQIFSSKSAVRENLKRFEIPLREPHRPHGRPGCPRFGQRMQRGKVVTNRMEQKVIEAGLEMRKQGLSLRQIARFLSKVGVPTKQWGVSWHPQMVKRLLDSLPSGGGDEEGAPFKPFSTNR